jgi:hypothetical protein
VRAYFENVAINQYDRRKRGKFHAVWFIDLIFGKDYCMMAWLDHKVGGKNDYNIRNY